MARELAKVAKSLRGLLDHYTKPDVSWAIEKTDRLKSSKTLHQSTLTLEPDEMRKKVKGILKFHATKSFGKGDLVQQEETVADVYRSLNSTESDELARHAIDSSDATEDCDTEAIHRCLACFQPGSLNTHHDALIEHGILYPGSDLPKPIARHLIEKGCELTGIDSSASLMAREHWAGGYRRFGVR